MATTHSQPGLTVDEVYHLTVDQFDRMVDTGILTNEDRVELLDGVLVAMTPTGDAHAGCVNRFSDLLNSRLTGRALIAVQNPIAIPGSRAYPDIAVLQRRADYYARGKPGPGDMYLVIEVADISLAYDRGVKLTIYSRAGIPETWVVDLVVSQAEEATRRSPFIAEASD
jgi:Uma2 family endonuclease